MSVKYWEVRVSGWLNSQMLCGEEMTADEAIEEMGSLGVKPEDCWAPTEITQQEYEVVLDKEGVYDQHSNSI